jgi:hypothetical protein
MDKSYGLGVGLTAGIPAPRIENGSNGGEQNNKRAKTYGSASTNSTTGTNTESTTSTNTNTNTNSTTGGNTYTGDAMANINPDDHQQQQKIISHLPKQQQKM